MRAWADDSYIRNTDPNGKPAVETCTYMKGQYYAGFYDDPKSGIRFDKVAEILRDQLVKQNYVMASPAASADLLLVINWGMTEEPEEDVFEATDGFEDDPELGGGTQSLDFDTNDFGESTRSLNAALIGASNVNSLSPIHIKRQMLQEAINQERYFINVVAYAMNDLRLRKKGDEMPKPKWITLLSVPLQGSEPDYAFGTMAETASSYFGKDLKNADFIRQDAKRATFSIGELEFLDYDEEIESNPPASNKE